MTPPDAVRPWLALYDPDLAPSLALEHPNAVAMFRGLTNTAPDHDLIRYFDTRLSVNRADALSGGFAAALAELGIARGDRVALYLQNVPQFVIALLGIWKLGTIAVPCNPMLRQRELRNQLRDCGATGLVALESLYRDVAINVVNATHVRVVVTTSELDLLDGDPPSVLARSQRDRRPGTDDLLELAEAHLGANPDPLGLGPDDPAILMYTSGTTGPPKGAINTHGNLVLASQTYRDWLHVTADDVILGIAPLFHITRSDRSRRPRTLRASADRSCVPLRRGRDLSAHRAPPGYRHGGCHHGLPCHRHGRRARAPRHLVVAEGVQRGAPIPPAVVEDFRPRTGIVIRSAYGLTETTGPTHLTPLGLQSPVDPISGTFAAGIPVFDTTARILDNDGEPLPTMEIGEVALSGPQVVPGYWNNRGESANAIRDGELLTGDIGKLDADGWLYIVDRKKDLIVGGGYKVWPTEVESALFEHPAVHEAAVVGAPDLYRGETV